jgi:hypothetical protein
VNPQYCGAAFINGLMHYTQSAAERGLRRIIRRRLFYRLVEQYGCGEKPLEQSVVQLVRDARTLSKAFFQTDIIFEVRLFWAGHPFP